MTRLDESVALKPDSHDVGHLCFQDLCRIVQECMDQGVLRGTDVNETSQAIWAGVHGVSALLIAKCGFPFVEHSRLIERVIDMTVEGMRQPA
jgi:hypothetical protein